MKKYIFIICAVCVCLLTVPVSAGNLLTESKTENKKSDGADKDRRVMTIEDYLVDGAAVGEQDLEGLDTQEDDAYDAVPGDTGLPGTEGGAGTQTAGHAKVDDWKLILVNKQNPVPEGYDSHLTGLNESKQVDRRIVNSVIRLMEGAKQDGIDLVICSAYRSYERQEELFHNKIDKLMASGLTYYDAFKTASYSVTIPGTSEHQLGLALDIITPGYTDLDAGFAETEAGKWLVENAPDYGFILRYPEGKEHITGIIFEPWHFRYVGEENAKIMTEQGLTLEEYVEE